MLYWEQIQQNGTQRYKTAAAALQSVSHDLINTKLISHIETNGGCVTLSPSISLVS